MSIHLRLYELVMENGRAASPFAWRIRYALAHKGLSFDSVPVGFTEIPPLFKGRFKTVPVLEHGEHMRESREKLLKATLEAVTADRALRLPALRESLSPLRRHLTRMPFLGGSTPNYADYIALGAFHWIASVSTLPLLEAKEAVLRAWLDRGFDLYGGLGRDSRMKPLFE